MPTLISDHHSKFIDRFMESGKYKMLNSKKENFMKNKQGFALPVNSYLIVNNQNITSLILIVEEHTSFRVFNQENELELSTNEGIILTDHEFRVNEISKITA